MAHTYSHESHDLSHTSTPGAMPQVASDDVRLRINEIRHVLMVRECGMKEILTKVEILRDEFRQNHDYNPIEHVSSRMKSLRSLADKVRRKGIPFTAEAINSSIFDIAGIRLTCSFVSDTYTMKRLLLAQTDLTLLDERDYIANPKPNGYQSLHLILEVPVFLAEGVERVPVEVQLRTVAMDFWASLEHKIHYKDETEVPRHLTDALKLAADMASALDSSMERLHKEILELRAQDIDSTEAASANTNALNLDAQAFIQAVVNSLSEESRSEPPTTQ
ncbi:GTP pyrophosphokinase family protein [Arcanobacterium haemolyticum]|nr:GTP pyrophosphokinase family protein [Arcanobacterium haemolyticum]